MVGSAVFAFGVEIPKSGCKRGEGCGVYAPSTDLKTEMGGTFHFMQDRHDHDSTPSCFKDFAVVSIVAHFRNVDLARPRTGTAKESGGYKGDQNLEYFESFIMLFCPHL